MSKVIGIDLGTGFSSISVIESGEPKIVNNSEGTRTTPSVVYIKGDERKIGNSAKRSMVMNPKNTVSFIKRFMGVTWEDKDVQSMLPQVTYNVVNKNGYPRVEIDDKQYSPEEISSYILGEMKKIGEDYYGCEVTDAVITCPAWYNNEQRESVKLAAELAGLNCLRIINEPTAAILASNVKLNTDESKLVLVADIGTGTTDFSLCEVSEVDSQVMVEVLASFGDVFLGGQNIDNVITNWICDEFAKDHSGFDLKKDALAYPRIIEAAEKAKIELSSSIQTDIVLPYITSIDNAPQMLSLTLTRAKFDSLIDELTDSMVKCGVECVKKAKKKIDNVDSVLLVGGTTRCLSLQEKLIKKFGDKLNKSVNPDEAVALGAAKQANIIVGGANDLLLLDVTPLSLGIETLGGVMTKLVEANTTIPCSREQIFSTASDNQNAVTIRCLQGERPMANDNKEIGIFNLDGIAPAKRGVPQILVKFDIDANGILKVSATDKATGKEQHITIENKGSLSQEEIERIKADAEAHKAEDEKKKVEIEKMNRVESLIFTTEKSLERYKENEALTEEDKTYFNEKIEELKKMQEEKDYSRLEEIEKEVFGRWNEVATKAYGANNEGNSQGFDPSAFGDAFKNAGEQQPQNTDTVKDEDVEEV